MDAKNECLIDDKRYRLGQELCSDKGCMICADGEWIEGAERWWRRLQKR